MNEKEISVRHQLIAAAQSMLDGDLSFVEGASKVLALRNFLGGLDDRDADFDVFVAIQSETDHLPLKEHQSNWSPDALKRLEPEFIRTEEWASSFASGACMSLIRRFKVQNGVNGAK